MSNMNSKQSMSAATPRHAATQAVVLALAVATLALGHQDAMAGEREQAKRMFDRLTGTPPSSAELNALMPLVGGGSLAELSAAALSIMNNSNTFYSVTLKNFATPWTNRDQTVFAPLNDYTATVIGMVRDNKDFRGILSDDIVYIGAAVSPAYSPTSNAHYEALESTNADLRTVLEERAQSSLNGLPATATAGVITSRAAAEAFFIDGTNRAMFRFTLLNHLCRDMEAFHDTSRPPDRIRQDVTRSPGGDSSLFLNGCVGCHSGMDPMAQAFAYYDYDKTQFRIVYTPNQVQPKYLINSDNFKFGYVTPDDSWENRWRLPGHNDVLGWSGQDGRVRGGNGAKSLGQELANSNAFAQCQVEKVFRTVCLRAPSNGADYVEVNRIVTSFKGNNYNLKTAFAESAAFCAGE